jgi:hypothetical protein
MKEDDDVRLVAPLVLFGPSSTAGKEIEVGS